VLEAAGSFGKLRAVLSLSFHWKPLWRRVRTPSSLCGLAELRSGCILSDAAGLGVRAFAALRYRGTAGTTFFPWSESVGMETAWTYGARTSRQMNPVSDLLESEGG
jgi:hypothetical protein